MSYRILSFLVIQNSLPQVVQIEYPDSVPVILRSTNETVHIAQKHNDSYAYLVPPDLGAMLDDGQLRAKAVIANLGVDSPTPHCRVIQIDLVAMEKN